MPCANQQDARELAVRARRRLQRNRIHAGDLDQALLQQVDDFKNSLRQRFRPIRMRLGQPLNPRHKLIHARVVLHRARAQRIHPQIDGVVPRREPREVANDFDLAQLRQQPGRLADARRPAAQQRLPQAHPAAAACRPSCPATTSQTPALRSASGAAEPCPIVLRLICVSVAAIYASTGAAASTFAARSIVVARHHFRRAPQRCVLQLRIPPAQLNAAHNLLVEQSLAPQRRQLPASASTNS